MRFINHCSNKIKKIYSREAFLGQFMLQTTIFTFTANFVNFTINRRFCPS